MNMETNEEQKNIKEAIDERAIYQTNKYKNKDRILFFQFLMYNTKIELHVDVFTSTIILD